MYNAIIVIARLPGTYGSKPTEDKVSLHIAINPT